MRGRGVGAGGDTPRHCIRSRVRDRFGNSPISSRARAARSSAAAAWSLAGRAVPGVWRMLGMAGATRGPGPQLAPLILPLSVLQALGGGTAAADDD